MWSKSYDSWISNINKISNSNNHVSFYIQKNIKYTKYVKNQQYYLTPGMIYFFFTNTWNNSGIIATICPVMRTHARIIVYPQFYYIIVYTDNKGYFILSLYTFYFVFNLIYSGWVLSVIALYCFFYIYHILNISGIKIKA